MNCLVTGAAGFLGKNLADFLERFGHKVIRIDTQTGYHVIQVDLLSCHLLDFFYRWDIECVFYIDDDKESIDVSPAINLLETSVDAGVKKFIFSSSAKVYGEQDEEELTEKMRPNPISRFGFRKYIAEQYCQQYHKWHGLNTICLRYFNIYGHPLHKDVISESLRRIQSKKPLIIHENGYQTIDLIYYTDVFHANLKALQADNTECFGEVFNIGSGFSWSVNRIVERLRQLTKLDYNYLKVNTCNMTDDSIDPRYMSANITKAKLLLDWYPTTLPTDGIRWTVEEFAKESKKNDLQISGYC